MSDAITKSSPDLMSSGLERIRGAKSKSIEQEKARLKTATKEFESFFTYQMLKTMRKTIPDSPFAKNSPMSTDAGKETFTDIFDMEIARQMHNGDKRSISELLYKSLEKIVESEFKAAETINPEIKDLQSPKHNPIEIKRPEKPLEINHSPVPLEAAPRGPFELPFRNETRTAQDVSKNPKAP